MTRYIFFVFIILLSLQFNDEANAQKLVLKPSESYGLWNSFEEWIYANSNLAYRSYDITSFDVYTPGHSNSINKNTLVYANQERLNTKWLNLDLYFLPNFSLTEIDSVIIDYNPINRYNEHAPNGTIEVFIKKKKPSVSIEHSRINPINDPGINLGTPLWTPNVEAQNYEIKSHLNLVFPNLTISFFYIYNDYARTNEFVYDREINRTLSRRTQTAITGDPSQQSVRKVFYGANATYEAKKITVRGSLSYFDILEDYHWHPISGIEIPSSLDHYQLSLSILNKTPSFYKGSTFSYNSSKSDTLNYTPLVFYGLQEERFLQKSDFILQLGSYPISTSLITRLYTLKDSFTKQDYSFFELGVSLNSRISEQISVHSNIANTSQVLELQGKITDALSMSFNTSNRYLDKTSYTYNRWNEGIGFSSLNSSEHQVIDNSGFRKTWSSIRLSHNANNNFRGFIFAKHYWQFVNEEIQYNTNPGSLKLDSGIRYFDSENVGLVGFQTFYSFKISPQILTRTMLGGNFYLYGNSTFKENFESVAKYTFSQTVQYKPDENVAFELFFRYLPTRYINEYQNLEEQTAWPPVRVRPIQLLNASVAMWFFDRSLELNLSLRNLLNSTESYDTNGQYYNMSINVSGKINVAPKRFN